MISDVLPRIGGIIPDSRKPAARSSSVTPEITRMKDAHLVRLILQKVQSVEQGRHCIGTARDFF